MQELFLSEYAPNSQQRFLLTSTEIRCISKNPKQSFTIPLNELQPYYTFGGRYSPLWLLGLGYALCVTAARLIQWYTGSKLFDSLASMQLCFFASILIFSVYKLYHLRKLHQAYYFSYIKHNKLAFVLPVDKKNKAKTHEFLQTLISRIHDATPGNEHTLLLLRDYNLLSNNESNQLEFYIHEKKDKDISKGNLIFLSQ